MKRKFVAKLLAASTAAILSVSSVSVFAESTSTEMTSETSSENPAGDSSESESGETDAAEEVVLADWNAQRWADATEDERTEAVRTYLEESWYLTGETPLEGTELDTAVSEKMTELEAALNGESLSSTDASSLEAAESDSGSGTAESETAAAIADGSAEDTESSEGTSESADTTTAENTAEDSEDASEAADGTNTSGEEEVTLQTLLNKELDGQIDLSGWDFAVWSAANDCEKEAVAYTYQQATGSEKDLEGILQQIDDAFTADASEQTLKEMAEAEGAVFVSEDLSTEEDTEAESDGGTEASETANAGA